MTTPSHRNRNQGNPGFEIVPRWLHDCYNLLTTLQPMGNLVINHGNQDILYTKQAVLLGLMCIKNAVLVIAHSSGEGTYFTWDAVSATSFLSQLHHLKQYCPIKFLVFSQSQSMMFFSLCTKPNASDDFFIFFSKLHPLVIKFMYFNVLRVTGSGCGLSQKFTLLMLLVVKT